MLKRNAKVLLMSAAMASLATLSAGAATFTWNGGSASSNNWSAGGAGGNWSGSAAPSNSTSTDLVFGGTSRLTNTDDLANSFNLHSINFNSTAGAFVISGNSFENQLGFTISQGSSSNISLSNNTVIGNGSGANGSHVVILNGGGSGILTLSGTFGNGNGNRVSAIQKDDSSTFVLTGSNAYGGATTINGGVLQANSGVGLSNSSVLELRGGVLQSNGASAVTFTRSLGTSAGSVNWGAGGGGFAANGNTMTVRINNNTNTLVWNSTANFLANSGTLILNSNTADNMVDFQNGIDLNGAVRTVRVDDNINSTADFARISGVLSGSTGSLLKTGAGRLELTAVNTFGNLAQVGAGTLVVANTGSISSSIKIDLGAVLDVSAFGSGFTIASGKTLSGSGTVSGRVNIANAANISPGDTGSAPSTLATGDQEWGNGGAYVWEIKDATGSAGSGYDQLQLTGNLNVTASSGGFTIDITSLDSGNANGNAGNFDKTQNYDWVIATTTGAVSIDPAAFTFVDHFTNDTVANGAPGSVDGAFSIQGSGNDVVLHYSAAPEPAGLALLGAGIAGWLGGRPARRRSPVA
jgi:autotransporter-associated beta strand protein